MTLNPQDLEKITHLTLEHYDKRAEDFRGVNYMWKFVLFIRSDVLATLSEADKREFAPLLFKS